MHAPSFRSWRAWKCSQLDADVLGSIRLCASEFQWPVLPTQIAQLGLDVPLTPMRFEEERAKPADCIMDSDEESSDSGDEFDGKQFERYPASRLILFMRLARLLRSDEYLTEALEIASMLLGVHREFKDPTSPDYMRVPSRRTISKGTLKLDMGMMLFARLNTRKGREFSGALSADASSLKNHH